MLQIFINCCICVMCMFVRSFRLSLIEEDFEEEDEPDIEDYDDEDSDRDGAVSLVRKKTTTECLRMCLCVLLYFCLFR